MKTYFNHQKAEKMKTTTNKKSQKQAGSYKAEILQQTGIVTPSGGQAYVRPEYHDRISEIIALFGDKGMTVEDYLDNVLTEHFVQCQDAIDTSLNRETKRRQRPDVRRMKRPVKGNIREIPYADAERLLDTFLEASEIKTRQCVYIDRETHGKIANIAKYLGNGLSIGKFVDNVLRDHLRTHKAVYAKALENIKPFEL